MSGLELPTATNVMPWVIWEPLSSGDLLTAGLTAVLGIPVVIMAAVGLWQMRTASTVRNRQLDAQTDMLAELTRSMSAATRSLEIVIEQTRREPA